MRKRCQAPDCPRMTQTAYGSEGVPMYLCADHGPHARRFMDAQDKGIRAEAFKEGQRNVDSDVIVPFEPRRRRPR